MALSLEVLACQMHISRVRHLADTHQFVWTQHALPKAGARAFQGISGGYCVLVIQANTREFGLVHEAMITVASEGRIIHLGKDDPEKLACRLYHLASTARN